MTLETVFYGNSNELPNFQEFSKTEPVAIRALNPEVEADVAIARGWDQESAGAEGALHPFEAGSREMMSAEDLRHWMLGDSHHVLRGIFDAEKDVGFVYAYDDLDSRKRLRLLQSLGLVPKQTAYMEVNWWTDRATPEQAESGITQTLLSLFTHQREKSPRRPLTILLYVEQDDLPLDGELAKRLGFKAVRAQMSYANPAKAGSDTAFLLTQEAFIQALAKR